MDGNPWEVFRDWNIYYNIGNVAGSTGAVVESLIGNKGGIISDAIASGLNGFFEGLINETCNSVYEGNSFGEALSSGYHEGFYRMGGNIATSLVSQDYSIPIGENGSIEFNLTGANHSYSSLKNHVIRSTAYHVGGNIFTGNAPFKDFGFDFMGINASLLIPAVIDGFKYYANKSGLSDRLLANQTSQIHKDYAEYMREAEINEIKYIIEGPIQSNMILNVNGFFSVTGKILVWDSYSLMSSEPLSRTFDALWTSKMNYGFLFKSYLW